MAEVHQVPEFGPMSGSTGKRKKYKKLVLLGAAARAKLASAMLAPLLALGATGLIALAVVEETTNGLPESPVYIWEDGGGQQGGNQPQFQNPKPPEPQPLAEPEPVAERPRLLL